MKSYKLENWYRDVYWFSKEPLKFSGNFGLIFKDGEVAPWTK